ncbi:hypothetical protein [Fodinicurvata halophila]|uniref:hypothetical protein n=1 Tax=Fodinicurvata halophila TaxID=1419723 RepID=UPI0036392002
MDYGPLEISGAPAGSYLFYVDGDTIQRFDFVDGTETFTLSDVSEDYLEGSNIFILPPEDSDVDFTLDVSLDAEALGQEVTFTGDVPVVLDAVADLPEIDAGGEGSNLDGDTFYFNEDHSLEGGEGGEGGEGYYPPIFDQEVPLNLQGQEFEGNDFPHEFPGEYGPCYQGWTPSFEPTYNLPFSTAITDRDLAIGRDEPSEGLIRVTLGLSENPENNTEVASALPEFGQYDEDGGRISTPPSAVSAWTLTPLGRWSSGCDLRAVLERGDRPSVWRDPGDCYHERGWPVGLHRLPGRRRRR